jgi:hypothetical protein
MRAFILLSEKPRILKQGRLWMCTGLKPRRRWFLRRELLPVTQYGASPFDAYSKWAALLSS